MEDDYNAGFSWAFYFGAGVCEAETTVPFSVLGTAFGSEAKASREGAGMVRRRLRFGVDLRLHFGGVCAGANGFWCCEGRRFQDKDEDIGPEEAFEHGSQIENRDFNPGCENSSRL